MKININMNKLLIKYLIRKLGSITMILLITSMSNKIFFFFIVSCIDNSIIENNYINNLIKVIAMNKYKHIWC